MILIAALAGTAVLGCLAVLQLLLIAGAPLGRFAWGGQNAVLPRSARVGSAVAIVLYGIFALLMLQAADTLAVLPAGAADIAIWVLTAYFAVGVAMNAASRSRPERALMTPVSLVLALLCLVLAVH